MFTIQSGARFDLKKDQLKDVFSKYGKLVSHGFYQRPRLGFDGFVGKCCTLPCSSMISTLYVVEFSSSLVAASLVNTLVMVALL